MGSISISKIQVRSVLTAQAGMSSLAGAYDYTINPYRGCLFGCSYCYASKFVYESEAKKADWGRWLEVKKNAVDALLSESHKLTGKTIFFSSATDPYQPMELRVGLTRSLLEILLLAYPAHVHIQTRSPHVVRDIDLLKRFGDSLAVGMSVTTDSDVVRKAFEPSAPSIRRRLSAAHSLREAGIRTIASIAPLLPATPDRLARLLVPCFHRAWVGEMNFYDKSGPLREIYGSRGWGRYIGADHVREVREALNRVGLSSRRDVT